MRKAFAIALAAAAILSYPALLMPQAPTSAPITNISYTVTFNRQGATERTVTSEMDFDVSGGAAVVLSLPTWTPGSYEIADYARNMSSFGATEAGKPLDWNKSDPSSWRIQPFGRGRVAVTFSFVADSLDNAASWSKNDFLLFNGTNLFLYPAGLSKEFPATVKIVTEDAWRIVTGMQSTGARTYSAPNYHDLVDFPFFVGAFDVDSTQIAGKWVRFASYPTGSLPGNGRRDVLTALEHVIPPEVKVFGEAPWRDYSVMQITDSAFPQGSVAGLEHQSSHVDLVSPLLIGNAIMPSIYAHEIFHSWNVKRLRPTDMVPYRYDTMQPTKLLWISEGITDYYADLAQVRGAQIKKEDFYELTRTKMADVSVLPPTSLEDASLSSWIHPRDGTEYVYYPKGSLAGFLLDIQIRDASDNRASLDDVMRDLYNTTWKRGQGFTDAEWWATVSKFAGGKSFEDFRRRYVQGRESYPYESVLPLAGLMVKQDSTREPRIGVQTIEDSTGVRVLEVVPGSSGAEAGVLPGDYLISVGDVSVTDPNFGALFRPKYANAAEGSPITIRVRRAGAERTLAGKLRFVPNVVTTLVEDPAASPKARAIREGLLNGTIRP
jgi:predicted metalloprotease with PDZ domain